MNQIVSLQELAQILRKSYYKVDVIELDSFECMLYNSFVILLSQQKVVVYGEKEYVNIIYAENVEHMDEQTGDVLSTVRGYILEIIGENGPDMSGQVRLNANSVLEALDKCDLWKLPLKLRG